MTAIHIYSDCYIRVYIYIYIYIYIYSIILQSAPRPSQGLLFYTALHDLYAGSRRKKSTANTRCQTNSLEQFFSTAGLRPGTGPWHQLYRAARGSPGICHFSFLTNCFIVEIFWGEKYS